MLFLRPCYVSVCWTWVIFEIGLIFATEIGLIFATDQTNGFLTVIVPKLTLLTSYVSFTIKILWDVALYVSPLQMLDLIFCLRKRFQF